MRRDHANAQDVLQENAKSSSTHRVEAYGHRRHLIAGVSAIVDREESFAYLRLLDFLYNQPIHSEIRFICEGIERDLELHFHEEPYTFKVFVIMPTNLLVVISRMGLEDL